MYSLLKNKNKKQTKANQAQHEWEEKGQRAQIRTWR